ncbi:NAD(P)H-hydrate dehydratase [Allopontixanthobacter sediminis]|uniref:Bifunctional NAD(P)H-hydrate repair enzyme n=1 Tax=Allopontixanthobacter sediminis TaxID=1689985 RepID=A0A845AZW3_9SPHN|nr:NAD(P)H-hydrate dehydratase [Allopontixanthobacter sediminis]MXP43476.1 NAD(P)H-hydrate dehydratase [Allopontixanthobacter sediminis]
MLARVTDLLPDPVLTVSEMRAAEQALIDAGTDVHELMQRAGRGAAEWVWRIAAGRAVTVLCGPGNNGGDGYVIAETLRARGLPVLVVAPIEPATEAAHRARGGYVGDVTASSEGVSGQVLVDCLFGSGLSREISADLANPLKALASTHAYRIAVDLPSGIESDRGTLFGPAIEYHLTLALGAWKRAHFLMPAASRMGALRLVDIGVDRSAGHAHRIMRPRLSAPAADAHKYRRGLLAIVGGAMPGAALLSAEGAMHSGAGYVKLLSEHSHPGAPADLVLDSRDLAKALSDARINALLVGPGLGRDDDATDRLKEALRRDLPTVLDADGLAILQPGWLGARTKPLVLTPHEGELAALEKAFGLDGAGGKVDRAAALAKATGAVVVAKGADTLVASPEGRIAFADRSSSWLSTAGTGDVLAGIMASRLANGAPPFSAACEAVWLHAEAARQAGAAFTAMELALCVKGAYAATL